MATRDFQENAVRGGVGRHESGVVAGLAQIGLAESEMSETEDQPEVLAPESAAESGEGSAETRVGPTLQALEVEKQEESRPGVTMARDASRARRLFAAPKRPA